MKLLPLGMLLVFAVSTAADDTVIYATGKDARGRATIHGTVKDFTGTSLLIETGPGRRQSIPAARVIAVHTARTADQAAGDQLAKAGRYQEAVARYLAALRAEGRTWVQREILAACTRSFFQLGQIQRAAAGFLALVRSDPATQYFDAIPLAWTPRQPPAGFRQQAAAWLADRQNPAARLIAASWLLPTSQRAAATAALGELVTDTDWRVALLAETQLWRTRLVTATPEQVARWPKVIARMPEPLRAGPYFLLGQAQARLGQHEEAALSLMRVPILYPGHRRLAAAALLSAGRELERIGQRDQAATLYREVVRDHPDTAEAAEAASRLEHLAGPESQ